MIWTDEAVEELKKMWDKGMTTGQIAKVLNVTKNSIIGKVHRLCLKTLFFLGHLERLENLV